jgi:hypothetical protein
MCLDKIEGIHLHVHVGLLFDLKWGFLCCPILGLLGVAKGGLQPHQRNSKKREDLHFFSNDTNSFFFLLFYSFPSIVFAARGQGISIDQSKILRA